MDQNGSISFREYMKKHYMAATDALRCDIGLNSLARLEAVYTIAFSALLKFGDSVKELIDAVYSDSDSEFAKSIRSMAKEASPDSLDIGDAVICEYEEGDGVFVFDGERIVGFSGGYEIYSLDQLTEKVKEAKRYAVLHPVGITESDIFHGGYIKEELTPEKKALVATAEAYLARGFRCQYDDSRFTRVGGGEYRWQIGIKSPEDYTASRWGYVNCAAFCYELYRTALGMDLGALYTTFNQMSHYVNCGFNGGEPMYPLYYELTGEESAAQIEEKIAELRFALRVGDLIVYRRHSGTGHVIAYVGNGTVIHSTGASYNYSEQRETFEPTIRYMSLEESLFNVESPRYLFHENIHRYGILRPLDVFCGELPENSKNRIENMIGVTSEKLCSVSEFSTAFSGDEIEYTICIFNSNKKPVSLDVCDVVPENTEYIDGAGELFGRDFKTRVCIGAGEEKRISYRVRVTGSAGQTVTGTAAVVGGVSLHCGDVHIGGKDERAQASRLSDAIAAFNIAEHKDKTELEIINSLYTESDLSAPFHTSALMEFEAELLISEEFYILRDTGRYRNMIAYGLYGGRNLQTQNLYSATCKKSSERVRLPKREDLVVGDIVVARQKDGFAFFLYTGRDRMFVVSRDGILTDEMSVGKRLEGLLGCYHYFVVLRLSSN